MLQTALKALKTNFSYIKDMTFLSPKHIVKLLSNTSFPYEIADLSEIVRVNGSEKQAIVSFNGSKK